MAERISALAIPAGFARLGVITSLCPNDTMVAGRGLEYLGLAPRCRLRSRRLEDARRSRAASSACHAGLAAWRACDPTAELMVCDLDRAALDC